MARIWTSPHRGDGLYWRRPERVQTRLQKGAQNPTLLPQRDILVRVASFTFRFVDIEHLRECLAYFQQKIHPSSRVSAKRLAADIGRRLANSAFVGNRALVRAAADVSARGTKAAENCEGAGRSSPASGSRKAQLLKCTARKAVPPQRRRQAETRIVQMRLRACIDIGLRRRVSFWLLQRF
jgi:hypothetical protein